MKNRNKKYERYKRGAEMQRGEVKNKIENMDVKAWGEQIATQKNLNEEHFGTPSKRTTPNIFFETPSPERQRESGAPRNTGNLARVFTTDFAFVSEPSNETLEELAMEKLKMNGSVPFSRKPGPSRYLRQYQNNKLNQLIQEAKERKAQAKGNEEELANINKELRKNLEKLKKKRSRKKSIRGGTKRSVRRKKKLQRSRSRSPRRKSHNRRRSTRSPRRKSPNRRRKSPNRRRSARGGKRSARNRRRRARSPRRKLAGKEFNSIRKYLDNMPMQLKVAFPGYVMYHIATDKEAFF